MNEQTTATASTSRPTTSGTAPTRPARARADLAGINVAESTGRTNIADGVVQKIASIAARDVSGVFDLGGGAARAMGAIRERFSSGSGRALGQGVSVEVGERQAAIDIDLVVEYGVSIVDLAGAVRRNVVDSVERMTGLDVTEVNISVGDIRFEGDSAADEEPRVQ